MLKRMFLKIPVLFLLSYTYTGYAQEVRDPTRPLYSVQKYLAPSKLDLQAVIHRKGNSKVVISGNQYGLGDHVSGYRIVRIEKKKVLLDKNGDSLLLTLRKGVLR